MMIEIQTQDDGCTHRGPTHIYGVNMSTIHNTQCPESQL